jgi:peptidoglycan/xylan/chitin deacetylase (PgdA/CDA1 family)
MEYLSGAANYLDKYGPDERYNVMRYVGNINVPVLAITGTVEVEKRFGLPGFRFALRRCGDDNVARQRRCSAAKERSAVVLLHDGLQSTCDALPGIIRRYRQAGFVFATVSELLRETTFAR